MGGYIPNTEASRQSMLDSLGLTSVEQLFDCIPQEMLVESLNIPEGLSELEVNAHLTELSEKNKRFSSVFRGAGAYNHYIPSIVRAVTSKKEFLTAYTPYQAEISQGVLQSIFEYQTMMCQLTGLDVSNASVYDGATAAAEAVVMCQERKRTRAVLSGALHPHFIEVVRTYCGSRDIPVEVLPAQNGLTDPEALAAALKADDACVLFQNPNYYGLLENCEALTAAAHAVGAKAVAVVNPMTLALLHTPGDYGADVAVGEGQPLGIPMGFGGPYLGFMTATQAMMRKLPGRVVGQTQDAKGNRAFVLTLQAREQHIRREKATSSVCSNEAHCALTAAVYLSAMGPGGLAECADQCLRNAHYAAAEISKIPGFGLRHDAPFFHEFVTECPMDPAQLCEKLAERGILGGLPVEGGLLWCATEMNNKNQIDRLVEILKEVAAQ